MSNIIIEKMEKQELLKEYDYCVKALAREAVDKGTINQELWDRITKIQRFLRDCDILEEIKMQLGKKEIAEIPISKENYFKLISKDFINLMTKKELYNNILKKSTEAAEFVQNQAARSMDLTKQANLPYFEEKFNKITSPMAAELPEPIDYYGENRNR